MNSPFQDSIVLIASRNPGNKCFGTGFVIRQQESHAIVLTCAHLIEEVGGSSQVIVDDLAATVLSEGDKDTLDLAILRVPGMRGRREFELSTSVAAEDRFSIVGFCSYGGRLLVRELHGALGSSVALAYWGSAQRVNAWDLRLADGYDLQPGYSGSPVIGSAGQVIGVVSDRSKRGRAGLAISIEALKSIWNDLIDGQVERLLARSECLVSNRDYLAFVQSARHRHPTHWDRAHPHFSDGQESAPVTWVSWDDAVAYCDWAGGSLPLAPPDERSIDDAPVRPESAELREWRDGGSNNEKVVCDSRTSRVVATAERDSAASRVGFRCVPIRPTPPPTWVVMEGGRFTLGIDIERLNRLSIAQQVPARLRQAVLRRTVRSYDIGSFKISRTCVTNEEYYSFTRASGWKWPDYWNAKWLSRSNAPFPVRLAARPVVHITAQDAEAYCRWSQTRLPNWSEWERAASGPAGRLYPWGDLFDPAYCNGVEGERGSLAAVAEYGSGDTPEGVRQLSGNVAEWVMGPDGRYETRGGGYRSRCEVFGLSFIFRPAEAGFRTADVGFRVVTS